MKCLGRTGPEDLVYFVCWAVVSGLGRPVVSCEASVCCHGDYSCGPFFRLKSTRSRYCYLETVVDWFAMCFACRLIGAVRVLLVKWFYLFLFVKWLGGLL